MCRSLVYEPVMVFAYGQATKTNNNLHEEHVLQGQSPILDLSHKLHPIITQLFKELSMSGQ
jgi:hypothetical protein